MWSQIIATLMLTSLLRVGLSSSPPPSTHDQITRLPGQPAANFRQFSGYVNVSSQRALFYYFVEAQTDPASKPIALYLNGGPGCSSLGVGGFYENGPFRIDGSGQNLVNNPNSWNKEANMIYLESPAGVGFSHSTDKSFYNSITDAATATDNLAFLEGWLNMYPTYKNRDLYIVGESYAGHYISQLAQLILESKVKIAINLKGIAVSNPYLDAQSDNDAVAGFLWAHGAISDAALQLVKTKCSVSKLMAPGPLSKDCAAVNDKLSSEIPDSLNQLALTSDVCLSSTSSSSSTPQGISVDLYGCTEKKITKYFNRKDVQAALHAKLVDRKKWSTCSRGMNFSQKDYQKSVVDVLAGLLEHSTSIRILLYSGDQDSVIPLTSTRTIVDNLARRMRLDASVPYSAWSDNRGQIGGWNQVYGKNCNLSFATIRGAPDLAAFIKPERALVVFKAFLLGKPLKSSH